MLSSARASCTVQNCVGVPPTDLHGTLLTGHLLCTNYQVWAQLVQPFLRSKKRVCIWAHAKRDLKWNVRHTLYASPNWCATTWWGVINDPPITRLLGHVATHGKQYSKECKKSWQSYLGQVKGQVTRGHQRSKWAYINIFLTNWHITREQEELQCSQKAHSIALSTLHR